MPGVKLFATKAFHRKFLNLLAEAPTSLVLISPFVTAMPPWGSVAEFFSFALSRGISDITLVTRPPSKKDGAVLTRDEAANVARLGVDLRFRKDTLHAKLFVLIFEGNRYAAFVGSSNLSRGGFRDNEELVVLLENQEDRPEVQREMAQLCGQGAFPYNYWQQLSLKGKA